MRTRDPHIRAVVPALDEALAAGLRHSPTLRALVDRVEASDLVVYLTFDCTPAAATSGHVTLMAASGGRRYVRISVNPRYDARQRIAILGHELRHVVEIAEAATVVDQRSLEALYRRIGYASGERSFDSTDAIAAGEQVRDEMRRAARAQTAAGVNERLRPRASRVR